MLLDVPRLEVSLKVSDISHRFLPMLPQPFVLPRDAIYYVSFHQSSLPLPLLTWIIGYHPRRMIVLALVTVLTSLGSLFSTSNDYTQLQLATTYENLLAIVSFVT